MLPLDQIEVFGAYISPAAVVLLATGLVWLLLREVADMLGLMPRLWHPALFFAALYVILTSLVVLWILHASPG